MFILIVPLQLCEIFTGKYDYPWRLSRQIEIATERIIKGEMPPNSQG